MFRFVKMMLVAVARYLHVECEARLREVDFPVLDDHRFSLTVQLRKQGQTHPSHFNSLYFDKM